MVYLLYVHFQESCSVFNLIYIEKLTNSIVYTVRKLIIRFLKRSKIWIYCRKMIVTTYIINEKWKTRDKGFTSITEGIHKHLELEE